MIIPDVNLIVYAFNSDAQRHKEAARWWEECLNGSEIVGLPLVVVQAFIRLLSNRSVVKNPYTIDELFKICDEWFEIEIVTLLESSQSTYLLWRDLMLNTRVPGSLSTDAFIAATAIENEAVVHTNDGDFSRFSGLKVSNPLS